MRVSNVVSSQPLRKQQKFGMTKEEYQQYVKLDHIAYQKVSDWRETGLLALLGAVWLNNPQRTLDIKKMKCGDWAYVGFLATSAICMITACIKQSKIYNDLKKQQNAN